MAIARKPVGKAKPALIEAKAETISVSAPLAASQDTVGAAADTVEDMQAHVRRSAEQGVEQSKLMFEKLKAVAEEATSSVETSLSTMSKGMSDINLKTLDLIKAQADAQFAFIKALLATKSISEAITLQGEHAKTSFAALNTQAKEIAALIQQVSADSVEPIKATFAKGLQVPA